MRRALSLEPGDITLHGPAELARPLADALRLASSVEPDALTHGFHVWPARTHRALAGRLIDLLAPCPSATVLDPFAGGGTVPIEALVRGHRAISIDANPLSALVVGVKTRRTRADDRAAFLVLVEHLVERSLERVRQRVLAHARLRPEHLALYGPHVLKELAGLLDEIHALEREPVDPADRAAALAVFSAIVVKLSNKRADTSDEVDARKRIRKGLATEIFERKARELVARWAALAESLGPQGEVATGVADARRLSRIFGAGIVGPVDLVVTSPPYGGTYDYAAQHALRLDWLGLPWAPFERAEIGARRRSDDFERWNNELADVLAAMRSVLRVPDGRIALILGDAQVGGRRIDAHEHLLSLAPRAGLRPIAAASETRPDWLGGPVRREHVVVLAPARTGRF